MKQVALLLYEFPAKGGGVNGERFQHFFFLLPPVHKPMLLKAVGINPCQLRLHLLQSVTSRQEGISDTGWCFPKLNPSQPAALQPKALQAEAGHVVPCEG